MEKFLELMAEVYDVEVEQITMTSDIREIEGFSSLVGFSIIVTIEDEYGVSISVPEFLACKTIADLYNKVASN